MREFPASPRPLRLCVSLLIAWLDNSMSQVSYHPKLSSNQPHSHKYISKLL